MNMTAAEREELWEKFLTHWPIERLPDMPLEDYTGVGNKDTFTYWIEFGTQILGSISGGGAFKFGIYSRKGEIKEKREHFKHDDAYSWYAKYGSTREEVFEKVRALIVQCANAASRGDMETVDSLDLGDVYKWKLAFLYQNRQARSVLPIYKVDNLRAALGAAAKGEKYPELYKRLFIKLGDESVFTYADKMMDKASFVLAEKLNVEDALTFFNDPSRHFRPIKPPSRYIAGFSTPSGRQVALLLDNEETTLFFSPGNWLELVRHKLGRIDDYPAERPRNSNLAANAPDLSVGKPAVKVRVPDKEALIALCDAYEDTDLPENETTITNYTATRPTHLPLNQILYGPPGTGKTYATIESALEILDPEFLAQHKGEKKRPALKARFDALVGTEDIRFVTFHQSFSYEDFVEGLRAETVDGQLHYPVVDGVFKSLCDAAAAPVTQQAKVPIEIKGRRIWKMSLGNIHGSDAYIYENCITRGYALLGYGGRTDFSKCKSRDEVARQLESAGEVVTTDSYALTAVTTFLLKVKRGDLLVVTEGNSKFRAIGEVTGDYECLTRHEREDNYSQCRRVNWLKVCETARPFDQLMNNQFSQMTLYELKPGVIDIAKLSKLLNESSPPTYNATAGSLFHVGERIGGGYVVYHASSEVLEVEKPNGKHLPFSMNFLETLAGYVRSGRISIDDISKRRVFDKVPETLLEPFLVNGYNNVLPALVERLCGNSGTTRALFASTMATPKVLIIDEINRGNVSRIFGELITLIEPSKRNGEAEALEVILPYSKKPFRVPNNVYLIGTMNTADRSLAGLDIALRRRFHFKEVPPNHSLLNEVEVDGVCIGELLCKINQRIEILLDRDHCVGHTYFLPLRTEATIAKLASIFRHQILPLLQEYFFEDWERIRWVLNDHRKQTEHQFVALGKSSPLELFGDDIPGLGKTNLQWQVRAESFDLIASYEGIIEA